MSVCNLLQLISMGAYAPVPLRHTALNVLSNSSGTFAATMLNFKDITHMAYYMALLNNLRPDLVQIFTKKYCCLANNDVYTILVKITISVLPPVCVWVCSG